MMDVYGSADVRSSRDSVGLTILPLDPPVCLDVWENGSAGCKVMDIHIRSPLPLTSLSFRNNYSCSITVKTLGPICKDKVSNEIWKVRVEDYPLMCNGAHIDVPGAQAWLQLKLPGVNWTEQAVEMKGHVVQLCRIIIKQPSPHWRNFGITDLTCYHGYIRHSSTDYDESSRTQHDHNIPYEVNLLANV